MRRNLLILLTAFLFGCSHKPADVLVVAHRGASSVAPENTLAAFHKAIDFGADYFELDVWLSRDDSLMVIHDDSLHRTTDGSGPVADFSYAELMQLDAGSWFDPTFAGERIPTLKQALLPAKENDSGVCIEVKSSAEGIVERIYQLVEKLSMANRVVLFSFDANQVAEGKRLNPNVPALYLVGDMVLTDIDKALQVHADAIGAGGEINKALIDAAHQRGLEFWKWTVNDADDMRRLIGMGADAIITNYPQRLRAILEEQK